MSRPIPEIANEIVEDFSLFDDWMDKYQYLIDMGQELPALDDQYKTETNIVHGCQSQVWLHAEEANGKIQFKADSDAIITKGLIAMLVKVFSDQSPKDVSEADLAFIDEIGMREHLSPTRSNGLNSMIRKMKGYALGFQQQNA